MATETINPSAPQEQLSAAEDVKTQSNDTEVSAEDKPVKKPRAKKTTVPEEGAGGEPVAETPVEEKTVKKKAVPKKTTEKAGETTPETAEKAVPKKAAETTEKANFEAAPKKATPKKAASASPPEADEADEAAHAQKLDFSDEEAELAAGAPEFDLGESDSEEDKAAEEPAKGFGFEDKTKEELLDIFADLLQTRPVQSIRREIEAIKVAFYKRYRAEVEQLKKAFTDAGGVPEEFTPPADAGEQRLKDLFGDYRRKRDEFLATLESSKEENLRKKLQVVEELKELVGGSETLNNTFNTFRELQQRWRDSGPVPQANIKDLWETYNHHVENFYSYIKINKELRDLDLRRNYEAKIALCEESEALIMEPSVVNAFHKLQKLHEQWREVGPVANEYKETLWERFKEASSRINKAHQEHFEGLKEEQQRNLELKSELCAKVEELTSGILTTRKEWNRASESLLEIQKVWKTIGFAPKKENTKIYESFRGACDRFFEQKREFYSQMKTEMDLNLQLKKEVCEAAEALSGSEEWKKATDELIALQKRWKEIGPVSRRHSDMIWKRFRAACDAFFEKKSQHFSVKDSEHEENLAKKKALLEEIGQADVLQGGFDMIKEFQRRWSEIGYVPIKNKDAIQKQYKAAMDKAFSTLRESGQARQIDRFRGKVQGMKTAGDKRLRYERDRLYNRVKQLESDVALLENNIGFFSKSKNAEAMVEEVRRKISQAREEIAATIEKINIIDNQE